MKYVVVEFHNSDYPIEHFIFTDLDKATRKRNRLNNYLKKYNLFGSNWHYAIAKREE